MKMKDAVYLAATLLQLDEACEAVESGEENAECKLLVRCANLVAKEICTEHFPLKETATMHTDENGEIFYKDFPHEVAEVFKSVNKLGESVPFREFYDRLVLDKNAEYRVTYSFILPDAELNGTLELPEKIGARVVAYGVAAEYCIISGMTDEAVTWDKRYKDALSRLCRVNREVRVKRRRWL